MKSEFDDNDDEKTRQCFRLTHWLPFPREMELIHSFKSLTGLVVPSTFLASKGSIFPQEFRCLTKGGSSSASDSKDLMFI